MKDVNWLERTELLIGEDKTHRLKSSSVLIIGLGGVGSYAAEFICRSGVGTLTIIDGDVVDPTNKNRQLPALTSTIGMSKAKIMESRMLDINPNLQLTVIDSFQKPEDTIALIKGNRFDYVMDCIDSVSPKLYLIKTCYELNQRFISSMGAGGKLDASAVTISDISETYNCRFAKILRKRLKKMNIHSGFKVVFNNAELIPDSLRLTDGSNYKKSFYGTISYMPALFGLRMASEVIQDLISE
jgi:tRNA A37 threonylcarbamoyladenosine dehydratase